MKNVIGGLIAIILGIFCFTLFFSSFLNFMAGILPISLIIGGGLILYLKHGEEIVDYWNNRGIADDSPKTISQTESAETEPVVTEPIEKVSKFLGNPSSFVFHNLNCRYSKNGKCTAVFTTREDALQQGYKPCGVCKP